MNVLAGLAEGVLDAILDIEDDPRSDPFAVALERYRAGGVPADATAPWRSVRRPRLGADSTSVLRRLDRDLLLGVVGYATGAMTPGSERGSTEDPDGSRRLGVIGAGGPMPSLEMAPDGTWHVAASATTEAQRAGDTAHAVVPTLASRYPRPRY